MSKKKIAESIIIRVGGGIREVLREPLEIAENLEPVGGAGLKQAKKVSPFGAELGRGSKNSPNKIIN